MLERFLAALERPAEVQRETLARLVKQLARGRFGREHGLDRLPPGAAQVDAFRRAVPLRDFEGLRAFIEPNPSDLSGEVPLCLLRTSASTGKPKLIPYTASFRDSIKRAHDAFTEAMFRDTPSLPMTDASRPRGIGLYQLSTANEHALGLPVDSYVSRLYDVALPDDPFFFAFDRSSVGRDVCKIADARERLFAMALAGARWDVRGLRATNPTTLLLLSRVLSEESERFCRALHAIDPARALALGRSPLTPRSIWPNLELLVTWRGGTCHLFEPHLRQAYGADVRIRAPIFAASEGVVAIPLTDADLGGAPAIESTFFELVPEGASETILLHEAQQNERYELVFTSPTGMTRYRIGDLVQVDGKVGDTPTFHFLARKGRTSSVTGEKLTELQIDDAMARASHALDLQPVHFVVSPQIEALPYYVLSVDLGGRAHDARLAAVFDDALMALNVEYEAKRKSARLGPLRVRVTKRGAFEQLQARGLSGGGAINFKLAHLSSEPAHLSLEEIEEPQ